MNKNPFIGITSDGKACILYSIATFDMLSEQIDCIESSDFIHRSTNWGGKDEINRTLSLNSYILTGREITLPSPIGFTGIDYDMGHEYEWNIKVIKIAEVKDTNCTFHHVKCRFKSEKKRMIQTEVEMVIPFSFVNPRSLL